jgi:hypothetical protein
VGVDPIIIDPRKARCSRMRRTVTEAAKEHERYAAWDSRKLGRSAYRKTFITLTYRQGAEWERCHVSEFIKRARQWMQRRGYPCRFVWVGELQKRGALHYHVLLWVPRRLRLPCPDRCGWWPWGMSKVETARNPVGYMVKYATKTGPDDLKRLPKGVRLHGNGGHDPVARVHLRETLAPAWLREVDDSRRALGMIEDLEHEETEAEYWERRMAEEAEWLAYVTRWKDKGFPRYRRVSGGFVDLRTGEWIETPWRVVFEQGVVSCVRKEVAA